MSCAICMAGLYLCSVQSLVFLKRMTYSIYFKLIRGVPVCDEETWPQLPQVNQQNHSFILLYIYIHENQ